MSGLSRHVIEEPTRQTHEFQNSKEGKVAEEEDIERKVRKRGKIGMAMAAMALVRSIRKQIAEIKRMTLADSMM